jgi:protein-disulfide isomerase
LSTEGSGGVRPRLTLPVGDRDHRQGSIDAPITLVEYGDYECPYCRSVYHAVKELQEVLGDRLQYVYRHLPITTVHPHAQLAAEAAEAAAAQGKFSEMHAALFEHDQLDQASLNQYAADIGLDLDQFRRDLAEHRYAGKVDQDFRSGIGSGVNGAPTFFVNGERYDGAWDLESLREAVEKPLGMRVRLLAEVFTAMAASGGIVLLVCTLLALLWANSAWSESYAQLWEATVAVSAGRFSLAAHVLEWVNDGLMVIFFFVVGLEIKREVTVGELASLRRAALPIVGALGGMLLPAALYSTFNASGPGAAGWGIPMATDIAFTLGVLTVLGRRVPVALRVFFAALAIADDPGRGAGDRPVLQLGYFLAQPGGWADCVPGAAGPESSTGVCGLAVWAAGDRPVAGLPAIGCPSDDCRRAAGGHDTHAQPAECARPAGANGGAAGSGRAAVERALCAGWPAPGHAANAGNDCRPLAIAGPAAGARPATLVDVPDSAVVRAGQCRGRGGGCREPVAAAPGQPGHSHRIGGRQTARHQSVFLGGSAARPSRETWRRGVAAVFQRQLSGRDWLHHLAVFASAAFEDPSLQAAAKRAILLASVLASVIGWMLLSITSPEFRETTLLVGSARPDREG